MAPRRAVLSARSLVSIVTPAYNAERWLPRLVASIAAQRHAEFEWIVIDDASVDRSYEILCGAAASDPRLRPLRLERNGGVANARNVGLRAARGRYLCFVDADDWWDPSKLEVQVRFMEETAAAVSYMDYLRMSEAGSPLSRVTAPAAVGFAGLLRSNRIGNLTAMARRSALEGLEFRPVGHEDYVFWLEALRRTGAAARVPTDEPLCFYTVRRDSLSADKLAAAGWQWRIYREVFGFGLSTSVGLFLSYALLGLRKRL